MLHCIALGLSLLFIFGPNQADAKIFRTSYAQVQLPNDWECFQDDSYWICRSFNAQKAKQAIFFFHAMESDNIQTLDDLETYLKQKKQISSLYGKKITSTVYDVRKTEIHQRTWVQAMQYNSEIKDFYSYYLATIENGVNILLVINVHKKFYESHKKMIQDAIYSLKVRDFVPPSKAPTGINAAGSKINSRLKSKLINALSTNNGKIPWIKYAGFLLGLIALGLIGWSFKK